MNRQNARAGNVVLLKTGGPQMTINSVLDDQAICLWFEGKELRSGNFDYYALDKIED